MKKILALTIMFSVPLNAMERQIVKRGYEGWQVLGIAAVSSAATYLVVKAKHWNGSDADTASPAERQARVNDIRARIFYEVGLNGWNSISDVAAELWEVRSQEELGRVMCKDCTGSNQIVDGVQSVVLNHRDGVWEFLQKNISGRNENIRVAEEEYSKTEDSFLNGKRSIDDLNEAGITIIGKETAIILKSANDLKSWYQDYCSKIQGEAISKVYYPLLESKAGDVSRISEVGTTVANQGTPINAEFLQQLPEVLRRGAAFMFNQASRLKELESIVAQLQRQVSGQQEVLDSNLSRTIRAITYEDPSINLNGIEVNVTNYKTLENDKAEFTYGKLKYNGQDLGSLKSANGEGIFSHTEGNVALKGFFDRNVLDISRGIVVGYASYTEKFQTVAKVTLDMEVLALMNDSHMTSDRRFIFLNSNDFGCIFSKNYYYQGKVLNDLPSGSGTQVFPDGKVFSGVFASGKFTSGTVTHPEGDKYSFENGQELSIE